jgi:hypothetical protein
MFLHPAIVVAFFVFVRIACVCFALGRMLGLSLAGGGDMFAPHIPALALLYFAFAPKPLPTSSISLAIAIFVSLVGIAQTVTELRSASTGNGAPNYIEIVLITLSLASHIAYFFWRRRDPDWGVWARV